MVASYIALRSVMHDAHGALQRMFLHIITPVIAEQAKYVALKHIGYPICTWVGRSIVDKTPMP